jgi:hypothetical protein
MRLQRAPRLDLATGIVASDIPILAYRSCGVGQAVPCGGARAS